MLDQLKASLGKKVALELVNGKIISGTLLYVDHNSVSIETDKGIGTLPFDSVQIIWEPSRFSLIRENMEHLAGQMRAIAQNNT